MRAPRRTAEEPPQEAVPDPPKHELEFIGLLLNFPQFIPGTADQFAPEALSDARTQALCRLLFDRHAQSKAIDHGMIINQLQDDALSRLFTRCAALGFDEDQAEQMWCDYLSRFQRDSLEARQAQALQALAQAAQSGDAAEVARIQAELSQIAQKRQVYGTQENS